MRLAQSEQPRDFDAAQQGAAGGVDERQQGGLVVHGMRDLAADADGETELLQKVHRGFVRRGPAAIHEILRGAVEALVIDGLAHGQLQKPV